MSNDSQKDCCSVKREAEGNFTYQESKVNQKENNLGESLENMVRIEGGRFLMGTNDWDGFGQDQEGPVQEVAVKDFYIDRYAVTNAEFAKFVKDTGYITEAEKFGSSFVFHLLLSEEVKKMSQHVLGTPWWYDIRGAYWAKPEGPSSTFEGRENHPVIHISWNDAIAYCGWAGKRLPTETEWEYAGRGGLEQKKYVWGDELTPGGEHVSNIWQGKFPVENSEDDGYLSTAPVDSFKPNGYGLYNVAGNVWEWCQNNFNDKYAQSIDQIDRPLNPQTLKTMRGGSYLCHKSYCNRYRVAARTSNTVESSTGNLGFRCAKSVE